LESDVAQRTDRAFVLRTHELGEADLIVTLLGESCGRVRGVARSARKSRRRFGGTLEPLTEVQARWTERPGRDLHRLDGLDLIRSHSAVQSDPGLQAVCAALSEVAGSVTHENQADPKGFRLMGAVLAALEGGLDPWVALRYFEYWTLRLHGLLPDLTSCTACGDRFDSRQRRAVVVGSGLLCTSCCSAQGVGSAQVLGTADREFLERAASSRPEAMDVDGRVARPGTAVEVFLRGTLEGFVERRFKAYRHLGMLDHHAVADSGPRS
jgi:DNA repair protein RecO (recombination protein O)